MKRSPLKRRTSLKAKPSRTDPLVLASLQMRSGGLCEMGGRLHIGHDPHHRRMKSQGGKDELANLIWVCRMHHDAIHLSPAIAYEKGWLVHSYDDPAEVPWTAMRKPPVT